MPHEYLTEEKTEINNTISQHVQKGKERLEQNVEKEDIWKENEMKLNKDKAISKKSLMNHKSKLPISSLSVSCSVDRRIRARSWSPQNKENNEENDKEDTARTKQGSVQVRKTSAEVKAEVMQGKKENECGSERSESKMRLSVTNQEDRKEKARSWVANSVSKIEASKENEDKAVRPIKFRKGSNNSIRAPKPQLHSSSRTERPKSWSSLAVQEAEEARIKNKEQKQNKELSAITKFREKLNEDGKVWLFQVVKKDDITLEGDVISVKGQKQKYDLGLIKRLNKNNKYLIQLLETLQEQEKLRNVIFD